MEELIKENEKLKERVKYLENIIDRGNSENSGAYNTIRGMIINKVKEDIDFTQYEDSWTKKHKRQQYERQIMRDLLWEIRVRKVGNLRKEHIEPAESFIKNYKFKD